MMGTFVNTGAIIAGSALGLAAGSYLPERVKTILMQALGLSTMLIGLQMALSGHDTLPAIGCLLVGGMTGELLCIERRLEGLGDWLKRRLRSNSGSFVEGFVAATLLYITGAMTIVGAIRDGTVGDHDILFLKALLDGVASIALASSLGVGVIFSALSVLIVQGSITLLASQLVFLSEPRVLEAVTTTGGLLILGIGLNLLGAVRIPTGNLLPALFYAIGVALIR
jgi:uncharacterized membrane protein YqgA involved in biofilm formation